MDYLVLHHFVSELNIYQIRIVVYEIYSYRWNVAVFLMISLSFYLSKLIDILSHNYWSPHCSTPIKRLVFILTFIPQAKCWLVTSQFSINTYILPTIFLLRQIAISGRLFIPVLWDFSEGYLMTPNSLFNISMKQTEANPLYIHT